MSRLACCRGCGEPLIMTFAWSRYEFYCVNCGAHLGFLEPQAKEPTPELDARYEELKAEWEALGGSALLGGGIMRTTCKTCVDAREPHVLHATDDERAAHESAVEALAARASGNPG